MIPFQNLKVTHESFLRDFLRDLGTLFQSPTPDFIGANSKTVGEFEKTVAEYLGVKHALGVGSGTDALLLALDALGIGPGDEVIVPAFGFIATADVVVRLGATPVFVDIDPVSFNIDPAKMEAAITERTRALIPVHLYGQAADMTAIMEIARSRNLPVIEDVAQAMGAEHNGRKLGSIGLFGAFSFYPTKNLGAAGDGGLLVTNDDEMARRIRLYRDHGKNAEGVFEVVGYNSRLDSIQARYLNYKLPDLDDSIQDRIENARLYNQLFADTEVEVPAVPEDGLSHSFNLYTIKVRDRDRLQIFLREKEIQTAVYYPYAMPMAPALSRFGHKAGDFPAAEETARQVLSLPIWPGLKRKEIERVAECVNQFLENNVALTLRR